MTPARSQSGKSRSAKKTKSVSSGWRPWWPLIVGAAVTPLAVKTAEILPLMGTSGLEKLRLLFPFAMMLREHALGLPETLRDDLAQWMLYSQFPLYGLYAMVAMRWKSWPGVLLRVAIVHFVAFGVVWLLTQK
jgi:hypothetical protein